MLLRRIFHPSDFSESSKFAFAHAVRIALPSRAQLRLMHVARRRKGASWYDFPSARDLLEQWGLGEAALDVERILVSGADPLVSLERQVEQHPTDLIVLATRRRNERLPGLRAHISTALAQRSHAATLFVPAGARGFVSPHDGSVLLREVLVPTDQRPDARPAIRAAVELARLLEAREPRLTSLHVGAWDPPPPATPPNSWRRQTVRRAGNAVDQILKAAEELPADVIVLTTEGRRGFLDALRGSTAERIVCQAPCPVLAVPARSPQPVRIPELEQTPVSEPQSAC